LEDVEYTVFKENNTFLSWDTKYQSFKEEYNLLQNTIAEYKKLKI